MLMAMSFAEVVPNTGFDATTAPPWLMVPVSGQNSILVKEGASAKVQVKEPTVKVVSQTKQGRDLLVIFEGLKAGPATAIVEGPMGAPLKLDIGVKAEKRFNVCFVRVLVQDQPSWGTQRDASDVIAALDGLNAVFTPQANAVFTQAPTQEITLTQVHGDSISTGSGKDKGLMLIRGNSMYSGHAVVFFVREIHHRQTGDTDALSIRDELSWAHKYIFIEDVLGLSGRPEGLGGRGALPSRGQKFTRTVAHEVLHVLRDDGHASDFLDDSQRAYLRYGLTDGTDVKLTKDDVNKINP